MAEKRPALGRGLSVLIPNTLLRTETHTEADIDLLTPNPRQPRAHIDEAKLDELARSIRANGVIQPIIVRQRGNSHEIITGERRWRAAQRAGLLRVPIVIRDAPDEKLLELALIENIQREDLNPIDEASAYKRLLDEHGLTQDQIAVAVGKDRSSVANYLRLLKLPAEVRNEVVDGRLTMGHARALLALGDEAAIRRAAREIVARALSVRETEGFVKKLADRTAAAPRAERETDVHTRAAEERLRFALGTRTRIVRRGMGGRIEIDFGSEEELQRLFELLTRL